MYTAHHYTETGTVSIYSNEIRHDVFQYIIQVSLELIRRYIYIYVSKYCVCVCVDKSNHLMECVYWWFSRVVYKLYESPSLDKVSWICLRKIVYFDQGYFSTPAVKVSHQWNNYNICFIPIGIHCNVLWIYNIN